MRAVVCCLLVFSGIGLAQLARRVRFHYDASEFANVVYHVACLGGQLDCTRGAFEALWHGTLQWTREDQQALEAWNAAAGRLASRQPQMQPAPLLPNYLGYYASLAAQGKLIAAGLGARSVREFQSKATAVVGATDAVGMARVLEHFGKRLHPWWAANDVRALVAHVRGVQRVIDRNQMPALASEVAAFLNSQLPAPDVYVHAILSPDRESTDSMATVRGNHFVVEIVGQDTPDGTAWKAMHELTHYFYDTVPREDHIALMKQFVASREGAASTLYEYVNEAIATGVQLLVFERAGVKDDDPYRQAYIPRLGRAAMPVVKDMLSRRATLLDGFVDRYIAASLKELGEDVRSPQFVLSAGALLASEKNQPAVQVFREKFGPLFTVGSDAEWKMIDELNAVRFMTFDELGPNNTEAQALTKRRGFAFVVPHATKSRVYFLVGRDPAAVVDVVNQLWEKKPTAANGLLFTLD